MNKDEQYIQRCFQLAQLGAGNVAPNPMVGAVLVHNDVIIGEGWHMQYGEAHAEVNCINSVAEENLRLIPESTIYVSLEPCVHFGKTPPCCDLILLERIPKVVISCRDSFEKVNGEGVKKLRAAGVEVVENILQADGVELNKRFFTFNTYNRPYIILKWAQSSNGRIAAADGSPVKISNELTNKLVHRWRSEEAAIVVGTNTALNDDPALTNRLWIGGSQPVRIAIDEQLRLPSNLQLLDNSTATIILNRVRKSSEGNILYELMNENENSVAALLRILFEKKLTSLIVEGGAKLLQSFINAGLWDEARIITSEIVIPDGIAAPEFGYGKLISVNNILSDAIRVYRNNL